MTIKASTFSRYFQLILIVLAGGAIYPLIYLRTNYQETILEIYNMNLSDLNLILSALGIAYVIGYFPSGWMADRFSSKKLLSISLLFVGLGGLWFAQVPSYGSIIVIFVIWGIFSVLTFWSAHLKLVNLIVKKGEEGKFFGILDGGKGVVEAILASIAASVFAFVLSGSNATGDKQDAFITIVYMYSIICIIVSILIYIFIKADEPKKEEEQEVNDVIVEGNESVSERRNLKDILTNPLILLLGGIIFTAYIVAQVVYYIGGYLETNVGFTASAVATITVIMLWMRPIGGIGGGILADKFGKRLVFIVFLALTAISLVSISFISKDASTWVFYVFVILIGLSIYAIRGLYWSLLGDLAIPENEMGLSIGFISFIGYMPDIVLPLIITMIMTSFGDFGYNAYLLFTSIFSVISIFLIIIFGKKIRN